MPDEPEELFCEVNAPSLLPFVLLASRFIPYRKPYCIGTAACCMQGIYHFSQQVFSAGPDEIIQNDYYCYQPKFAVQ